VTELTYKDAGVDIDEGARAVGAIKGAVRSTYTPEVIGDLGGFGGLFSAAALKDMAEPVLVSGTDGVGTKLELAKRLGKFDSIGIDLVAMCVNDIVVSGARPLFFLDYLALGKLDAAFAAEVVGGIAEGCRQAGCALIGGEMAEHPGVMEPGDFDLSGFAVGAVDRPKIIGPERVVPGDIVLGLASSGFHSNGYSLVRKAYADELGEAEFAEAADALIAPTRIYVKPLLAALDAGLEIHAAAHITGGGITENLNRVLPVGTNAEIVLGTWFVPEIIDTVIEAAGLNIDEALKTFNMGIGMALVVPAAAVGAVTKHFLDSGEKVYRLGEITPTNGLSDQSVLYRLKDGQRLI
jgi:phosphoribosylformylglycinamidine cyclo-ligase